MPSAWARGKKPQESSALVAGIDPMDLAQQGPEDVFADTVRPEIVGIFLAALADLVGDDVVGSGHGFRGDLHLRRTLEPPHIPERLADAPADGEDAVIAHDQQRV